MDQASDGAGRAQEIDALEQRLSELRAAQGPGLGAMPPAPRSMAGPVILTVLAVVGVAAWLWIESGAGAGSTPAEESMTAAASPEFIVTLGQGQQRRSYTHYPVTVRNLSGKDQDYIFGECLFYSTAGDLVYRSPIMWRAVPDRGVAGESIGVEAGYARYQCRAWAR
jgi:hypothetical protein